MTETTQLHLAATRMLDEAMRNRTRADLLRATADLTWAGPGADAYREAAAQRWAGLVRLAEVQARLADELRELAWVLEAA